MGGDHGHHGHGIKIPDYRIYKVEDAPALVKVRDALARQGLKDPWLRNYVWQHNTELSGAKTRLARYRNWVFRGFKLGATLCAINLLVETVIKRSGGGGQGPDHGHGHEHDHHSPKESKCELEDKSRSDIQQHVHELLTPSEVSDGENVATNGPQDYSSLMLKDTKKEYNLAMSLSDLNIHEDKKDSSYDSEDVGRRSVDSETVTETSKQGKVTNILKNDNREGSDQAKSKDKVFTSTYNQTVSENSYKASDKKLKHPEYLDSEYFKGPISPDIPESSEERKKKKK